LTNERSTFKRPVSSRWVGGARMVRALLWAAGLFAICAPFLGAVPLPGEELVYTVVVSTGFGVWLAWAIAVLIGGPGGTLELTQAIIGVVVALVTVPGTQRTAAHAMEVSEEPLVAVLYLISLFGLVAGIIAWRRSIRPLG